MKCLDSYPDSWSEVALSEINQHRSQNVQPKSFPSETFELWSVPVFPTGKPEIQSGAEIGSSKQAVKPLDVLICKINPRINRVWIVDQNSSYRQIASSEWIIIRQPLMEPRYLLRFFQSGPFRTKLCADVTGVGGSLTRAQPKKVATFPIVVPPLAEQKVLADKLDTLLAQVETTKARLERIPQILKRFRQSVLAAAVSGRLTEEWHYEEKSVGDVCVLCFDGPFGSKLKTADYTEAGVRVVRLENIGHLHFNNEKKTFISEEKYEKLKKNTLHDGDVLFSSFVDEEVRVCSFKEIDFVYINKADCFCLRPNPNEVDSDYLAFTLASLSSYAQIKEEVQGVTRPRINLKILRGLKFNFPDLQTQVEIVYRVNQLFAHADRIEQQVLAAQERVNNLTQSILAKAFRGELTEQWRKDNPDLISGENSAAALLERIKVERAATAKSKRRTSKA